MARPVTISWSGGVVSGRLSGRGDRGILLAHGAGTNQDHPFMALLRDRLAGAGHRVLTFNYPYAERGSKRPDRAERLVECHRGAADGRGGAHEPREGPRPQEPRTSSVWSVRARSSPRGRG